MSDRSAADIDLAVIAGDGIGPEVVAEGLKVLEAVTAGSGTKVSSTAYDLGAARWNATGETLPDSVLDELRAHDVILLGAIGDPSVPSGVLERGILLPLRFALDHFVNLRPAKLYPGVESPLAVEREARCVDTTTGKTVFSADLGAPGLYVPRRELTFAKGRLVFAKPEKEGLRITTWSIGKEGGAK